jgi:hypothetical protein
MSFGSYNFFVNMINLYHKFYMVDAFRVGWPSRVVTKIFVLICFMLALILVTKIFVLICFMLALILVLLCVVFSFKVDNYICESLFCLII